MDLEFKKFLKYMFAKNNMENSLAKKIVKLNGGLGNQMFEYAFACALQYQYGSEILFDFAFFNDVKMCDEVTTRFFELDVFNLKCKPCTVADLALVRRPEFESKFKNSFAKKFPHLFGINYFREKNNTFYDKNLVGKNDYYYYEGYFQNEKYFKHLRNNLVSDFSLKIPIDEKNQFILDKIKNTDSVSVHIRRGDYVTLDYVNKIHGVCSLSYYEKAIEYIAQRVKSPHFFLFSDDIQWVIENLKINYPFSVVDFNQEKGWFDLNLMKNCKHHIIANSSFSWWGAWLNENPSKIVIAPKRWTANKQKCDIIPSGWVKL